MEITPEVENRFRQSYRKCSENECWEWLLSVNHDGYGRLKIGRRVERAHRVSYVLHRGQIPEGMLVCHRCDNPRCVNPKHLFLGTPKDNMADMVRKGRAFRHDQRGERNHGATLSRRDACLAIELIAKGMSNTAIAERLGVAHSSISSIRRGKTWRELRRPDDHPAFDRYGSLKTASKAVF